MRRMAAERPPLILSKIHFAGWPYSTLLPGPWAAADGLCWHTSRESHPSEDLSELPPLLDPGFTGAVAGQEYHYQIADEGRPDKPAAMRNSPPQATLWTDGHRSAPSLAVFDAGSQPAQVVLAHPPASLQPPPGGPLVSGRIPLPDILFTRIRTEIGRSPILPIQGKLG